MVDFEGTVGPELLIDQAGNVSILGTLTTIGSCSVGCDRVFQPGYALASIEEHAESMWKDSHLPAVGPTRDGEPFNVSEKTAGILNELETAHIYIQQLNDDLKTKETRLARLESRLDKLEAQCAP
jgi:hypothetical protein